MCKMCEPVNWWMTGSSKRGKGADVVVDYMEEKKEEGNISVGTSTGDLPIFPPRSSQTDPASSTPILPMQAEASCLVFQGHFDILLHNLSKIILDVFIRLFHLQ